MEGNQHILMECLNVDSNGLSTAQKLALVKEEKESDFVSNTLSIAPVLSNGLFMTEVLPYKDYLNATVKKEPCSVSSNSTQMCDKQTVICSPDGHLLEYSDVLSETIDDNLEKTNHEENITKFLVKECSEHVTAGGELFPTLKDLLGENKSTSLNDNCTSKHSKIKTNNDLNNYSPINSCSEFSEFEQPISNNSTNINLKESKRNSSSPSKLKIKLKKRSRKLGKLKYQIYKMGGSKVHCKSKKNKSKLKKLKRKIEVLPNETKIKSVMSLKPRSIRKSDFQRVRKKVKEKIDECEDLFSYNLTEGIASHKDATLLSDSSIQDIENKPKSKNISRLRLENSEVLMKDKFQLQLSPLRKDLAVEIKGSSSSTMGENKYPTRTKNPVLRTTSRSKSRSISPRRRHIFPRRKSVSPRRRPLYPKRIIKSRSRSITPKILTKRIRRSNSRLGRCRSRSLSPQQRFTRRYRLRRSDSRSRWKERYKSRSSSRGSRSSSRKRRSLSRHRRRKTSSWSRSSPRYRSRSNSQRSWSSSVSPLRKCIYRRSPLKISKVYTKRNKKLASKLRELFSPTKNKSGRHSSSMSISPESPRKVSTIVETFDAVLNAPSNKIETISSTAPIKLPSSEPTHFQNAVGSQTEQMLKPYIHQFPLTVRETDVLPTQLVIPHTYLAPILVNTSKPPPARCMPQNQPSTFITSQQHYEMVVDTSIPPPSHLSNFNAFQMGASHINLGNINVQHEFNLFPNITQSHCLQGQSRRYQNYFQSENNAYFGEKHFIKPTIKSPPLPSCPPPPLPPPPPPPSPPPLQVGRTANNADTSSVSNIEVKITSSRTSSLLEQNKSDHILKITPSGTSPSLLEHHKSDRISTLWSKLGPVLSSNFKINDIVAEQETNFTALMKPQVPIDKIKQFNSNFNKAELYLKDNIKQTHRENTDTSRVCMKKMLEKSFTIFQNKINKSQENVTNQTSAKNTKIPRLSTENLNNLIDHKSNRISNYKNPVLDDSHKKTCAVADGSINTNTNIYKNESSLNKSNYLSSAQEAKPLTHTFPGVLTTDHSTKLNAYSSTKVNENKHPPIKNTINTDMTHSSKKADTGSIANQISDKTGNEIATNTNTLQISETLKSSSKDKEISEGKNSSNSDLPIKSEMGNLYKKSALHNLQINNSERSNTHSSDIAHDCIDKISLMSVPTDVGQATKDKLQIDTESPSQNISTKMYQTELVKSTKHENNGASKRKSRPPSKFTLNCKPAVEISHSNTKDIGKETLKQQTATVHSQEKKSDLKDNSSTSRPANINYSSNLEVDQSGVKISHTKITSSIHSLSCFQYLPTHLFPNNPLLDISKGGIALKNIYKEAKKHKFKYPDIKLCSIPYIKLKVIRNIHDEKREIERILSIRKNKECVSVNETKDSSLTYSASNTKHGKSLSVMHILNHMIADLTVKRRTVATQVTRENNILSGLVKVQPMSESVTYPEWLKQAMEIVSKQSVICDE